MTILACPISAHHLGCFLCLTHSLLSSAKYSRGQEEEVQSSVLVKIDLKDTVPPSLGRALGKPVAPPPSLSTPCPLGNARRGRRPARRKILKCKRRPRGGRRQGGKPAAGRAGGGPSSAAPQSLLPSPLHPCIRQRGRSTTPRPHSKAVAMFSGPQIKSLV